MAVDHRDMVDVELTSGTVFRSFMNLNVGEGDHLANRYGVNLFRNGVPNNIDGYTVTGYFVRADGTTIVINGTASGNRAYVNIPAMCYAVEGSFTLTIKVNGSSARSTVRIIDGTVINTTTESVADSSSVIPNLAALEAMAERAEAAAEDIAAFSVYAEQIAGDDYRIVVEVEEEEA